MILILYNLALLAALVLGAPWWLWRMATTEKYREGLGERLGRVRSLKDRDGRALIWIHAVSVGEVLSLNGRAALELHRHGERGTCVATSLPRLPRRRP